MEKFKKYAPKVIVIIAMAFLILFSLKTCSRLSEAEEALNAANIALSTEKDSLQKANAKLGLAETSLVTKESLIADYEETTKNLKKELDVLKSKVDVKPISKDSVVVVVDNTIKGGEQTAEQTPEGTIEYRWSSKDHRFKLYDPDIAKSDNEEFKYDFKIKVTGYVLSDESGNFQARQVIAQEILPDGSVGRELPIENNIFQYSIKKKEASLLDIFHPRLFALLDTSVSPGFGVELLNLGNYIKYANVGIGPFVSVGVNDLPNSLQDSKIGLGVQYTIPNTNLGLGVGVSTPANDLFQKVVVSGNLVFMLTN